MYEAERSNPTPRSRWSSLRRRLERGISRIARHGEPCTMIRPSAACNKRLAQSALRNPVKNEAESVGPSTLVNVTQTEQYFFTVRHNIRTPTFASASRRPFFDCVFDICVNSSSSRSNLGVMAPQKLQFNYCRSCPEHEDLLCVCTARYGIMFDNFSATSPSDLLTCHEGETGLSYFRSPGASYLSLAVTNRLVASVSSLIFR